MLVALTKVRVRPACRAARRKPLSKGQPKPGVQDTLVQALRNLLKPESVKVVRITHAERGVVNGFLVTHCPVGKRDHWEDFEAHLARGGEGAVRYAIVDGRKLMPVASGQSRSARA